jgi:putative hydrolase of the HAD superfamily
MKPNAVLFDLDDTLADRAAGLRKYANLLHEQFSAQLRPCLEQELHHALLMADDFGSLRQAEALAACRLWRSPPDPALLYDHWQAHFGGMAICYPGSIELLSMLKQSSIKLGIITNGGSAMQRSKLVALGIGHLLDAVVVSEEVGLRKPDPRIFKLALEQLECEPNRAWFVGDHPEHDIRGAAAAGLTTFWVMTGAIAPSQPVIGAHLERVTSLTEHLNHSH